MSVTGSGRGYYAPDGTWKQFDDRVPIIAQMASRIFCEKQVYHDNKDARRLAIEQAFLLYGEIVIRLAENDK